MTTPIPAVLMARHNPSIDRLRAGSARHGRATCAAQDDELVVPSSDFQVGVAAAHENGNIVFSETTFSTAD
jgi:hypothetical protein